MDKKLIIPVIACAIAPMTQALDKTNFDVAGFASFGYEKATISNPKRDYSGKLNDDLYGIDRDGDYRNLSKMGVQLNVALGDKLSFTSQMLAKGQDNYKPTFDWLYATYQITPELALSAGRFVGPVFMHSDAYEVAYAFHWARLPYGAYSNNSFPIEGAKLTWQASISSDLSSRLTLFAGDGSGKIKELNNSNLEMNENKGLAWEVSYSDWLNLRAVHFTSKASLPELEYIINDPRPVPAAQKQGINDITLNRISADPLAVGYLASLGLAPRDVLYDADDLAWKNERISFSGIGMAIDTEYVFFNSEYTKSKVDGLNLALSDSDSWYAMIGARVVPSFSVGLTFSSQENKAAQGIVDNYEEKLNRLGVTNPLIAQSLISGLQNLVDNSGNQRKDLWTLGTRWDFTSKAALKVEYIIAQKYIELGTETRKPQAFRISLNIIF